MSLEILFSWIVTIVGCVGFWLGGKKLWWSWYVNIANQIAWVVFALITGYHAFLVGTAFYMFVFVRNAYLWTKEHFDAKKPNRDNYCYGRWDGANWIARACTVPGVPHAPHEIDPDWQGWDFNRYDVDLIENEPKRRSYIQVEEPVNLRPGDPVQKFVELEEPLPEGKVLCDGRPRLPGCKRNELGHIPHIIDYNEVDD